MTPIYSEKDKQKIVINFISLRGQGKVHILDFKPLVRYLKNKRIRFLHKIEPTGVVTYPANQPNLSFNPKIAYTTKYFFNESDAEEYFNWLISIIAGAEPEPSSEETVEEAYNQIFLFIFALRDKMDVNIDSFLKVRFEWENWVSTFDEEVVDIKRKMDTRNERVMDILEKIRNWQEVYQPYLDRIKADQDAERQTIRKALGRSGKDESNDVERNE